MVLGQRETRSAKLLFVTTSLGTKWESYSQALIRVGYPRSRRLVLDGTRNWFPLMFLKPALAHDSDYTIHIDEDCFLLDPAQLDQLISRMDQEPNIVMAGVPDGGHYYREHNPYACNLFFLVFKTKMVRRMLEENPDWMSMKFQEAFTETSELDLSTLDKSRIQLDDYEPYYGLFWAVLASGKRIMYLKSSLDSALLSTDVHFNGDKIPMARHMWYLRSWNQLEMGPHDRVSHRQRYSELEHQIARLFQNIPRFKRLLRRQNLTRRMRSAISRAARAPRQLVTRW